MSDPASTPMMQQYRELKARDPDALLLFRMGDFYEMFGEDAERAGALLGLAVTSRDKGPNAIPMAGFPHPALESYLAKLVQAGQRAAVCEQVEDPKLAKGLVKREVVRVVTPGTLTDDALMDPRAANYLAAVTEARGRLGLAWVELSTGRFALTEVSRTRAGRRDGPALARRNAHQRDGVRRPLGEGVAKPVIRVDHGAALVGFPARAGPHRAVRPLPHDDPRRLRRRG